MFEHRTDPLLPQHRFAWRVVGFLSLSAAAILAALGIGVVGYHYLGGMGPVDPITSSQGKLFASAYALFSGLLFIGAASLALSPFVHRIMHKLHIEDD